MGALATDMGGKLFCAGSFGAVAKVLNRISAKNKKRDWAGLDITSIGFSWGLWPVSRAIVIRSANSAHRRKKKVREATTAPDLTGRFLRYTFYDVLTLWDVMRFSDHRRQYTLGGLGRADLAEDPVAQFVAWQDQAIAASLADPTACVLATQQTDQTLRQRMVLMKGVDARGLVFYTNYQSGKAAAIEAYDQASMLFPWNELDRQVSVCGSVERVSGEESDAYFSSRPRDSQLGAWASCQSQAIGSREALMKQLADVTDRFGEGDIPRPPHWGGYRLTPESWEFWQGGESRLHDRFRYTRTDGDSWQVTRLQP